MNVAVTEGVELTPPPFSGGLGVYSSGDGTPGSASYADNPNAAFVPADQDFGGCLEILKTQSTQTLRYTGQTPIKPGCYLRITARIKAVSGSFPAVRIAGFAGGNPISGAVTVGQSKTLTSYGTVVEVSAIVGTGARGGVDMVWGPGATYGHFGLDLTGQNGGVVRIDDLVIEDVSALFALGSLATVDVVDFGAIGDGITDNTTAFEAANSASDGRTVLVPKGIYRVNGDVTFDAPTRFEGRITMPTDAILLLRRNFDLPAYIDAFEDEAEAFRKAFQALLNNADHESLDMGGRVVGLTEPLDMQAAVPNKNSYATRRVIRNGQIEALNSSSWDTEVLVSQATYTLENKTTLTGVVSVANVQIGSLVTGVGIGREVYVKGKNEARQEVTLSAPLYDAVGTQNFTFTRFKYLMDFTGFEQLSKFIVSDIEFQCNQRCSAVILSPSGITFQAQDCFFSRPKDRGLTSPGLGCQGMLIDRCQFLSGEDSRDVPDRVSIALNSNGNDIKLRNNRATKFRHFAVIGGSNNIVSGNHFFQGDGVANGIRFSGLVITTTHCSSIISANYIDNCFIEWSNETDAEPEFATEFSFSALSISDNIFLSGQVAPWFSYLVVKPHGSGHFLSGINVTGNKFRSLNGQIDRVERVDTSFADLNYSRMKNILFQGNSFHNIDMPAASPLRVSHSQATNAETWVIEMDGGLPFNAQARAVDSVIATDQIKNSNGTATYITPYVETSMGPAKNRVHLRWGTATRGDVQVIVRIDD